MKCYQVIAAMLFPVFLIKCGTDQNTKSQEPIVNPSEPQTSAQKNMQKREGGIMGIVYAAGLTEEEKTKAGIKLSDFQIVTDNKNYFLGGGGKFKHLIGKCVHMDGKVIREEDPNFFNRGVFIPSSISVTDAELCNPPYEMPAALLEQKIKDEHDFFKNRISQIGQVFRIERPRPDVNYDYGITFLNPFKDIYHQKEGNKMVRTKMAIIPTSKEIHMALDTLAESQNAISIFGYPVKGHENSTVYQVFQIVQDY